MSPVVVVDARRRGVLGVRVILHAGGRSTPLDIDDATVLHRELTAALRQIERAEAEVYKGGAT